MNASSNVDSGLNDVEAAWKEALVQAENAWRDYTERLRATEGDEAELGRLWLRLWRAERRRDELLGRLE